MSLSPAPVAPRYLLDANILLRRIEPAHTHHGAAIQAVRSLINSGEALFIAPQCMYEFWAVATRPVTARGLGLTIAQADRDVLRAETLFSLLPDNLDVYHQWRRLVRAYSARGKPSHDARLVACMLAHGITHLLTFNDSDFRRYVGEGITIIDPAHVPPSSAS